MPPYWPASAVRVQSCRALWTSGKKLSAEAQAQEVDAEWETAKPYSEIPGPKPLPIPKFGNFWRAIPGIGNLDFKNLSNLNTSLYNQYGPIVKFGGFGRPDVIMLYDPNDAEKMFRNESVWPFRPGLESMDYYRRVTRNDIFEGKRGILNTKGEEWATARSAVNKPMLRPTSVINYHEPVQDVTADFIERIRKIRDEKQELPENFINEMNKWALESISMVALETRLGCLEDNLSKDSEAQRMIDSVEQMFKLIFDLDFKPSLWQYCSTPKWNRFVNVMETITSITLNNINRKIEEINKRPPGTPPGTSMLEAFLSTEKGKPMAVTMAIDMMTAGIDTTSSTSAIALYYISKHPEVQEKVLEEVKKILPNKDSKLTREYLNEIPYMKAVIKESQRLTPLALGNSRAAGKDMIMKGYRIPKGTHLVVANKTMCAFEEHYPKPLEFIPERWLKSEKGSALSADNTHPFVFMPFGFGPRMCIGRRLAELEMHTFLAMTIRNFQVSYNYGEMEWGSELLVFPKSPLKFQVTDRDI